MVVVDMRVDHDVHVLGPDTGLRQPVQEVRPQMVEERHLRPGPVVARARVDEDHPALAAQHPGLDGTVVRVGLRPPVVRRQPGRVVPPDLGRTVRDHEPGGRDLALPLDHLGDLDLAEKETLHTATLGHPGEPIHA